MRAATSSHGQPVDQHQGPGRATEGEEAGHVAVVADAEHDSGFGVEPVGEVERGVAELVVAADGHRGVAVPRQVGSADHARPRGQGGRPFGTAGGAEVVDHQQVGHRARATPSSSRNDSISARTASGCSMWT